MAINIHWIQSVLEMHFPGGGVEIGPTLNGDIAEVKVWYYRLFITLTTRQVMLTDVVGSVQGQLHWDDGDHRRIEKNVTLTDPAEIVAFIEWCRMWVLGVAQAILSGMEESTARRVPDGVDGLFYPLDGDGDDGT